MADSPEASRRKRVAQLNDQFRTTGSGGRMVMTLGVQSLGSDIIAKVMKAIREFNDFNADNDPHGEHDFGEFETEGYRFFFKIDYHAPGLEYGSEDPTNPEKTMRVLTIMLPEEY